MNAPRVQNVTILGATGSIGVSTLDVLARHPERYRVYALAAQRSAERLFEQILAHRPRYAVLTDPAAAAALRERVRAAGVPTEVLDGADALCEVAAAPEVDQVMAAIVGAAGLLPTLAAARAGKRVLLANKEALVMSGALFMEAVRTHGATLLPIDSEHNAVFQCLPSAARCGEAAQGVTRVLLTGSGGPFRQTPLAELAGVSPAQACAHPNWSMGPKISVDSATMMNKGLEVIEAAWLFALPSARIDVVVHPQSVIHSMVEYADGSVLAQLGHPDMRTPIAHALAWPERIASGVSALDFCRVARLDFLAPDVDRFPCLRLAYDALAAGGTAPAILNAANEVAVAAFLDGAIRFTDIARTIAGVLDRLNCTPADGLEAVLAADARARAAAATVIAGF
ncbi:1-deoxy-D-xylulose 5-phosphate reductoisomerase [Plasticicumulans lactativorans]|uniref:1-deoxy-D-xylulose 5-phosphate reductoisomerase n=1 Tax=Plasticicumulans lactativorans TaxID=1133106 RepID=A0A4V2SDI8_9GAMM|nr:1-deoxy-D-xylulose-5-phosphate reductoisomerase [Plasticicumulans lactativorans]TCO83715.1 1-deoxy-D-xylulose 5-phosphate reductoisomerase [Plasticicumulans lactativorans]